MEIYKVYGNIGNTEKTGFLVAMIIFVIVAGVYLMIGLSAKQNLFVIEYTGGRIQFRINTGESLAAENFLKRINNARNQEKRSDHQ